MPLVAFESLPDDARVWVFGTAEALSSDSEEKLLTSVDGYLSDWRAHGSPLMAARDWRYGRFLAIGLDQRSENASGCSLDALFRVLSALEAQTGTSILGNARVYFRGDGDAIETADRAGFGELARSGIVDPDTVVFDLSVSTAGDWRTRFEAPAALAWHRSLLPGAV